MGQHADDFLEEVFDYEYLHERHASGDISDHEAYELGLIDEFGCVPKEVMHHYNQVDDIHSLNIKLQQASLELEIYLLKQELKQRKAQTTVQVWVDKQGKKYLPSQMTTAHLINAIRFAERSKDFCNQPLIQTMKQELEKRKATP